MSKIIPSSYELLQFYVYYLDWVNRSNVKDNAMFSKKHLFNRKYLPLLAHRQKVYTQ